MYELKTNTAVRIAVGPLVDPGDGKTAEVALTVTGMSVEIFQIKNDGNAVVRVAFNPTTDSGNNDMVHVTDDTTGMYDLELTAAQLNWYGNGRIAFYDVDGFLVHWIDIQVVSANYFDHKYGTTNLNSNVMAISGDTDAADNCELMFGGTGYAGGTTKLDVNVASQANIDFGALQKASINAEVVDALATDTYAEPGQGDPAATASLSAKIGYLYKTWRNKITQTSTTLSIYNDAGNTVDQKATVSDDATTFTRGELGTGA
jgi:hypothetical protein